MSNRMKNGAKASGAKVKGDKANVAKQHATHPTAARVTEGRESDELATDTYRPRSRAANWPHPQYASP